MKILKIHTVIIAIFVFSVNIFSQNTTATTAVAKTNFWSKLVHNTEMGFLLGEQAAIKNNNVYPY